MTKSPESRLHDAVGNHLLTRHLPEGGILLRITSGKRRAEFVLMPHQQPDFIIFLQTGVTAPHGGSRSKGPSQ